MISWIVQEGMIMMMMIYIMMKCPYVYCMYVFASFLMECKEFILSDWSPPDDPARVLAAEGSLNPSVCNRTV